MVTSSKPYYILLSSTIFIIYTSVVSLNEATKLGFSVELIHRDSPNSPFYDNSTTPYQKLHNAFRRSMKRMNHFYPNAIALDDDDEPESKLVPKGSNYIMAYSLGTGLSFKTYGTADTGSDLIWLQCEPCPECSEQTIPAFKYYDSTTYGTYDCHSEQCQSVNPSVDRTYCDVSTCQYQALYLDGSVSIGLISHDTFKLASTSGGEVAFPNTLFGCAHSTFGFFLPDSSGIVGLGRGSISLISQMGSSIEGKFSYCLTPSLSKINSKLHFGQSAVVSREGTVSTGLVSKDSVTNYYVSLEAISVEDKRIEFNNEAGNTVIDSGSTLTMLPKDFYTKVVKEVIQIIERESTPDPINNSSLCYESETVEGFESPILTLHFNGGADVALDRTNIFHAASPTVICFAFQPTSHGALIGNVAQINHMVGYDLQHNLVSFKPMDCTNQP